MGKSLTNQVGRPPAIRGTDHQELVDQLLASGWTSAAISLYLRSRFGKEVEESTIRRYRIDEWDRIAEEYASLVASDEERVYVKAHTASDGYVDTLGSMAELIRLQRERLEIGLRLEKNLGTFLVGENRQEIKLMNDLLHNYHSVLQDWGVVPKAGMSVDVSIGLREVPDMPEQYGPLIEILDTEEQEKIISISRAIHARAPAAIDAG